jgi:hypothetical protein
VWWYHTLNPEKMGGRKHLTTPHQSKERMPRQMAILLSVILLFIYLFLQKIGL